MRNCWRRAEGGQCPNTDALAAFLCESGGECDSFSSLAASYCRGGINRGRGDAPMTWTDPSAEEGAKFQEEILPPSAQWSDAQLVGVSRAAPDLSGDDVVVEHGALAGAQGRGRGPHSQTVLPRHQTTVRRFSRGRNRTWSWSKGATPGSGVPSVANSNGARRHEQLHD
jgi:hypothetical protein